MEFLREGEGLQEMYLILKPNTGSAQYLFPLFKFNIVSSVDNKEVGK